MMNWVAQNLNCEPRSEEELFIAQKWIAKSRIAQLEAALKVARGQEETPSLQTELLEREPKMRMNTNSSHKMTI